MHFIAELTWMAIRCCGISCLSHCCILCTVCCASSVAASPHPLILHARVSYMQQQAHGCMNVMVQSYDIKPMPLHYWQKTSIHVHKAMPHLSMECACTHGCA